MAEEKIFQVNNLTKFFPIRSGLFSRVSGHIRAVDSVSLQVEEGLTMGLVGESGCGKSTLGRTMLNLLSPTGGEALYRGQDVYQLDARSLRELRKEMQIIFQDPYSSLNPRLNVGEIVGEALRVHGITSSKSETQEKVEHILKVCGLAPYHIRRYPHEFSGGQRQRIGIARALVLNPKFIVADEPIASLDVSIQAQIVNLMEELKEQFGLTYLFISHDLSMVRYISDRVAVMYLGKIVELADTHELYKEPLHPYTEALISAIPTIDPVAKKERIILKGDVPSPANPPSGCYFHPRCPYAFSRCKVEEPEFRNITGSRYASCHLL